MSPMSNSLILIPYYVFIAQYCLSLFHILLPCFLEIFQQLQELFELSQDVVFDLSKSFTYETHVLHDH